MLKEKTFSKTSNINKYNSFYFCSINNKNMGDMITYLARKYKNDETIYMETYLCTKDINCDFTREYSNFCTINYHKNFHEFIAFDENGIACGLMFFINECEFKFEKRSERIYKKIKIDNVYIDFNMGKNFNRRHPNYLKFLKLFLKTKKFYIYFNKSKLKSNGKGYFYFFTKTDSGKYENLLYLNFYYICDVNKKCITNKKDQETYDYFQSSKYY